MNSGRRLPFVATFKHFAPLKGYFIENRWALAAGLFSLLLVDGLQVLIPLIIRRAINLMTEQTATPFLLLQSSLLILGIAIVMAIFRYIWRFLIFGHSRKVEEHLRNRMYEHLQTLPQSFYHRTKTGDLMARSINDINAVRMAVGMGLVALTDGLILGLTTVILMLSIDVRLTLISLLPAPLVVVVTRILTRRMSIGFDNVQKSFSDVTERVREAFSGIRVVKAFTREEWAFDRIKQEGDRYISENLSLAKTLGFFFPLMAIFTNAGLAVVIWFGGRLTILGSITTGDFVAFTAYLNLLSWPMMAMGWVTNLLQRGSASMRRINRVLEEVPESSGTHPACADFQMIGHIQFRNLSIRHPDQASPALREISLTVKAGETVALVGRVGSGKSTLLQAIPRILEVPPGTIFVDGRDVVQIPLKTLRKQIGFVTQEVFIFSDTVRNNVLFGRSGVSEEDLRRVLEAAGIYEEALALENGLDTPLGERGVTLSGGQRQRLTIARALLKDPPVLILDDALSMVDTRTEALILSRIGEVRRHKTNLIVSHRPSTLNLADRIVVLDKGMVVEHGTHMELIERGGIYTALYERQLLEQELENANGKLEVPGT
jgi:ATP-binding cassette, subfamily B, multidrug efflux pump